MIPEDQSHYWNKPEWHRRVRRKTATTSSSGLTSRCFCSTQPGLQRLCFTGTRCHYSRGCCVRTARGPGRCAATGGRPVLAAAAKPVGTTATPACSPSRCASLLSWWRGGGGRRGETRGLQSHHKQSHKISTHRLRRWCQGENSKQILFFKVKYL